MERWQLNRLRIWLQEMKLRKAMIARFERHEGLVICGDTVKLKTNQNWLSVLIRTKKALFN